MAELYIKVRVDGIPKGQPRPRAFARKGAVRVYDPSTAEGWKSRIAAAITDRPARPYAGPIWVVLQFIMPRPKSHYRTGKNADKLKPLAPEYPVGKPDIDNLVKAVLDALSQIGVWRDDTQVVWLIATKRYGDRPGLALTVEDMAGGTS